jgi:hypothetical protein
MQWHEKVGFASTPARNLLGNFKSICALCMQTTFAAASKYCNLAAVFLVLSFAERRAFGPNNGAVELIHSQVVIDAPEL